MVSPSNLKLFPNSFCMKSSWSSSSSSSSPLNIAASIMKKLKTLIQTLILSHMRPAAKVLSKAKSILSQIFKHIHLIHIIEPLLIINNHNKKNKQPQVDTTKLFLGSFRMHYNWCSDSHHHHHHHGVNNVPPAAGAMWNSLLWIDDESITSNLSSYPSWLQEKEKVEEEEDDVIDDIDKMAGAFIANCHEKFKLEKQESDRKFHEMLARSV